MAKRKERKYKVYPSNGGLRVTVPKSVVQSMEMDKETYVKWLVKNDNELFMKVSDGEEDYKLYNSKGQFRVTLPKSLANALGIKEGSYVKWIIHSKSKLILQKIK